MPEISRANSEVFALNNFSIINQLFLPITAGTFIYIAGSDLIPMLHTENNAKKSIQQLLFFVLGVLIMYLMIFLE